MNPPGPREITNKLSQRTISGASGKKESKKRKHKDSKEDKGPPRKGMTEIIIFLSSFQNLMKFRHFQLVVRV